VLMPRGYYVKSRVNHKSACLHAYGPTMQAGRRSLRHMPRKPMFVRLAGRRFRCKASHQLLNCTHSSSGARSVLSAFSDAPGSP